MKYTISTGRSRKETHWKVKTMEWDALVEKLRSTTRTPEKQAEYTKASKDIKSDIKDVGGFVGGAVSGGRRVKGSVKTRSLVTLDIDYAKKGVWENITTLFDCAMCMYSTHSYTKETPRFRLVVPLDREVGAEEYEAIARKIAERIDIEQFDDSSYQAERLMYWPSTSSDAKYVFEVQEGEPLNADSILAEYVDWKDMSQWPTSSRVDAIVKKLMRKKGEPTDRPGIVGAFCRAYTISEAIEQYLSDVYQPVANDENRYTYMQGSSSGGLVVYEDKFAYSHHATDPACEQMCNAFDLVRVHLFGEMDADAAPDTPVNRLPSYAEMSSKAKTSEKVKAEQRSILEQRLNDDFGDIISRTDTDEAAEKDDKWLDELERDKNDNIKAISANVILIMENARGLRNNIRRNDFSMYDEISKALPWRRIVTPKDTQWTNDDDARLRVYLDRKFGIKGSKELILNCFTEVTTSHRYHPVRDYLSSLEWDGMERVEDLFVDYLGAANSDLTRAITRKVMAAAVARVFNPGVKFDYVTVLQGSEGIGKSTLLNKLAGDAWFSDSLQNLNDKDAMDALHGAWIIELGELMAIKRSEIEQVKAFLSRQTDKYRPAYGRTREEHPRQCVFFATTNEEYFLKGNDGNRRFWIVACGVQKPKCSAFDFDKDPNLRDQIWAEAVEIYKAGERLYLSPTLEAEMRQKQAEYNISNLDPKVGMIGEYLNKMLPVDWNQKDKSERIVYLADEEEIERKGVFLRDHVCAAEVISECLSQRLDDKTTYHVRDINAIIASLKGWTKDSQPRRFPIYGLQRGFTRVSDDDV